MRTTLLLPVLAAILVGPSTLPALAVNLVSGGSFESPVAPNDSYLTATPTGWTPVGSGVDIIRQGYSGAVPDDAEQFIDLIGGEPGWTFPSGVEQTVALDAGVTYTLSFAYASDTVSVSPLEASLGSLWSDSLPTTGFNAFTDFGAVTWGHYSTTVTPATSGFYALRFVTTGGSFGGPYLDSVSLEAQSGEVPEAETWIAGALLVGVAGSRLRSSRQ